MIRELPMIDVAGELYYIDLRLNEMRHVNDFMNRIFLDDDLFEKDDKYLLAYDKIHKCVFRGDKQEYEARMDKEIIIVELPSLQKMDPVGFEWLCENLEEHQRTLTNLLRFADAFMKNMESNRQKDQFARRPLLEKNRTGNKRGRKL